MATLLETDIAHLSENIAQQYAIPAQYFEDQSIKRGLRNADGTGVLIGVSKVGSVQGYYMMDGERVPMPGKSYYRGAGPASSITAASASRILSRPIGKAARSAMRRSRICCCSALCPRRRSSSASTTSWPAHAPCHPVLPMV